MSRASEFVWLRQKTKGFLGWKITPTATKNNQIEQKNVIQDDLLKGIRPLEIKLPENEMERGQAD